MCTVANVCLRLAITVNGCVTHVSLLSRFSLYKNCVSLTLIINHNLEISYNFEKTKIISHLSCIWV